MSFILDALKKSEERRQKDQPHQGSKHIIALRSSRRHRWPLWLLLVLLPLAVFSGWWLGKTSDVPPAVRETVQKERSPDRQAGIDPTVPTAKVQPAPTSLPAEQIIPRDSAPKVSNQNSPTEPKRPATTASAAVERVPVIPAPVPSRAQPPAAATKPKRAEDAGSAAPVPATTLPPAGIEVPPDATLPTTAYADLSREVKNRLPPLEISLHYFSPDPARRMVRLNNQLLHEGDLVVEGLTIEEITPSAVILDYHGLPFRLDRP